MNTIFNKVIITLVFFSIPFIGSSTKDNPIKNNNDEDITDLIGAKRYINHFNYVTNNYALTPINLGNSTGTKVETEFESEVKIEGEMSLKCDYEFADKTLGVEQEKIRLQKIWQNDFISDLSFYPLGISLWLNSSGTDDRFTINLLQQNEDFTLKLEDMHSFTYFNDTILRKKGWQQLNISYDLFRKSKGKNDIKMNLSRINGYQFDIENISKHPHKGTVYFDAFEQLTSYKSKQEDLPMFSSIFVQLHHHTHDKTDWLSTFKAYREIRIDTVIIQRAVDSRRGITQFFYSGSTLPQIDVEYDIINKVFAAAKSTGMKIIVGLNQGKYPDNKGNAKVYDDLYEKNLEIIDDLYDLFSDNPSMAGWYISEEFHDGRRGWWKYGDRMLLASYQQRVAAYAKSKPKKFLVAIAPALWRGRPADMTYEFFRSFFEKTPDIDILYLQDCGGRCAVDEGDFFVTLPHWYSYIKKACDETGVQFGVDIESFKSCESEGITLHSKEWDNLKNQLFSANIFTKNITQFSWATFRPGVGAFGEYREYLKENGKLRISN